MFNRDLQMRFFAYVDEDITILRIYSRNRTKNNNNKPKKMLQNTHTFQNFLFIKFYNFFALNIIFKNNNNNKTQQNYN